MSFQNDLGRYSEAGIAKLLVDHLEDHFSGVQSRLDTEIFHKLDEGVALTAEEALQFVYMKHANYLLLKKLGNKIKAGQNAGQRIANTFNGAS